MTDQDTFHTVDGLIEDASQAYAFIFAGNSTFTLKSVRTGERYTFRVRRKDSGPLYFVSTLTGPDNEDDYTYLAYVIVDAAGMPVVEMPKGDHIRAGRRGNPDDTRFKALNWLLRAMAASGKVPLTVELWHEGRCGRCNRKLTDPESIARGLGPECANK